MQKCDAAIEGGYDYAARETFRLMAKVRGNEDLAEQIRLAAEVQWKDRAMHSLAQVADAATKDRSVGMSLATVLRTPLRDDPSRRSTRRAGAGTQAEQADPFDLLSTVATRAADEGSAGGDAEPAAGA